MGFQNNNRRRPNSNRLSRHRVKLTQQYIPFIKPNSDVIYVSNQSKHPNQILKQLFITINAGLNNLSSNQESFNRIEHNYQSALKSANHKFNLTYQKANKSTKKQRKRKVIFFNPPLSLTVATKIGKEFLNVVKKHFDANHPYHKTFNRNTLKISYSSMENFKTKILKHNNKILNNLNLKKKPATAGKKNTQLPSKMYILPSYYKNKQHKKILRGFNKHDIQK